MVGFGVCIKNIVDKIGGLNEWKFENIAHGFFVIFNNGYAFSHKTESINNKKF
jgi:hypothetical protein